MKISNKKYKKNIVIEIIIKIQEVGIYRKSSNKFILFWVFI